MASLRMKWSRTSSGSIFFASSSVLGSSPASPASMPGGCSVSSGATTKRMRSHDRWGTPASVKHSSRSAMASTRPRRFQALPQIKRANATGFSALWGPLWASASKGRVRSRTSSRAAGAASGVADCAIPETSETSKTRSSVNSVRPPSVYKRGSWLLPSATIGPLLSARARTPAVL